MSPLAAAVPAAPRVSDPEAMYRVLAETSTDVVSLHDPTGRYHWVSPSVGAAFGFEPGDLVGRNAFEFIHTDDAPGVLALLASLEAGQETGTTIFRFRRAGGDYVWTESALRAIRDARTGDVTEIRVSSRDVSARIELERAERQAAGELRRRLAQTAALARLGERAVEERKPTRVLDAGVAAVAETLEVPLTAVVQLDGEGAIARAGHGWEGDLVGTRTVRVRVEREEALELIADGPLLLEDPTVETRFEVDSLAEHGVTSTIAVLIGDRDAPWGVLSAHTREPREFDEHDRDFLQSVAHVMGDAIERHRAEEWARHEALHDATTGLPNRALLLDRLTRALDNRRADGGRLAAFFIDLDEFKLVNDSLGHEVGDELLADVGPRLAEALSVHDTIARFGGDSFVALVEEVDDEAHAQRLAERIVGAFARPFVLAGDVHHVVGASVGVVVADGSERADDVLRDADAAMFRAKEAGRARFELFDPILRQRAMTRLRVERELRQAIANGELRLHFQPIWALPGRELDGVEALVRWEHPERGLVPPGAFIPIAERSGLILPVGTWVLEEACRQLAAWRETHPRAASLRLTVNLSAHQVNQPCLPAIVRRAIEANGLEPGQLGLEITEGLLMQDSAAVAATLRELKALGVRLVLDDFGTGYSSLSYVKRFPLDQLKIDRSFVAGIEEDGDDRAIVTAITAMAKALGLAVVPEGVETEEQLRVLEALGCEYAQGFLLSRPLPPGELAELL